MVLTPEAAQQATARLRPDLPPACPLAKKQAKAKQAGRDQERGLVELPLGENDQEHDQGDGAHQQQG